MTELERRLQALEAAREEAHGVLPIPVLINPTPEEVKACEADYMRKHGKKPSEIVTIGRASARLRPDGG